MINERDNPVEWPLMLMELEEVKEHIESLIEQMASSGKIDEEDFRIQIFHTISHMNRLWNGRKLLGEINQEKHDEISKTPTDFVPVG